MRTTITLTGIASRLLAIATASYLLHGALLAQDFRTASEALSRMPLLQRPLIYTGPFGAGEDEAKLLLDILVTWRRSGRQIGMTDLEMFLTARPDSGWSASLHENLGKFFRDEGRYSLALHHWVEAWNLIGQEVEGPGKIVGDYVLAHWTRLLASLGRTETLALLIEENKGRVLDRGPLSQMWVRNTEAFHDMVWHPWHSFKCGTYALDRVATAMGLSYDARALVSVPSPETGFTVKHLADLASTLGIGLVPVLRDERSAEIVIPSVVHWAADHYAAIIGQRGQYFEVVDPTFGHPKFLTLDAINAEASGVFLVPSTRIPPGWRILTEAERGVIVGRGNPNMQDDASSQPCSSDCPSDCPPGMGGDALGTEQGSKQDGDGKSDQDGAGAGSGGSGDDCESCDDCGMPVIRVQEPYINVWLFDQPMSYQPALGQRMRLKLAYKQRDESASERPGVFNFGQGWNCNWLSCVVRDGTTDPSVAVKVHLPGGGVSHFAFANNWATNYHNNYRLQYSYANPGITSYTLHRPDGSRVVYELTCTDSFGDWNSIMMSYAEDPQGHTTWFEYTTCDPDTLEVRLSQVIDPDGKTNTVEYLSDETYSKHRVGSITDPYGRTVSFTRSGYIGGVGDLLTSVTDVIGLATYFEYDDVGWPETMVTPYGTNSFVLVGAGTNYIDRSAIIIHPDSTRDIYRFVQYASYPSGANIESESVATNLVPISAHPNTGSVSSNTLDTLIGYRNSYYWNRGQSVGLPEDASLISTNDHVKARMRHWLGGADHGAFKPIDTLSIERDPSPDGVTPGHLTWYDYTNKGAHGNDDKGDQVLPAVVARKIPDNTNTWYVWYQRNGWGKPTNIVSTYTLSDGSVGRRTNSFGFATNGLDVLTFTNAAGVRVFSNSFNAYHQVLTSYNALNEATTFSYDSSRRLTGIQRPTGLTTTNSYYSSGSGSGRLQTSIDIEIGRTNSYTYYSTNGLVRTHTDELGLARTFTWDALDRQTGVSFPDSTWTSNYFTSLDLTKSRDRLGKFTTYGYDSSRRLVAETNALGTVTRYGYCDCGGLTAITNAFGTALAQITEYRYDEQGNRTLIIHPDGTLATNWFNLLRQITATGDAIGLRWFGYNNQGLRTVVTNNFGIEATTLFNSLDLPWTITDANGVTITNTYDSRDRLLTRTYPDTGVEKFVYAARGLVLLTNQLSQVTRFEYDAGQRKISETNANSEVIRFTYDAAGNLKTLTDGKTNVTTWNYDAYGRVANKYDQANVKILEYTYDANGRLTNRWSKAKGNTGYLYDDVGNLTKVDYPSGTTDITLAYDALSRVTNMVDAAGTTVYAYHANGQVLTEDGPWSSDTVTYSYNGGRLRSGLSLAQPTGSWTNGYGYDSSHRLSTVTFAAGTFTNTYKGPGNLVTYLSLPNTAKITNAFDSVGRLTETKLLNSLGTVLNKHLYLYNLGGQRIRHTRTDDSYYTNNFDNIGQLLKSYAYDSGGFAINAQNRSYGYDGGWNLRKRTNNSTVYSFNVNVKNELTNTTYASSYTHDSNGNLTAEAGLRNFQYDAENQLTRAYYSGGYWQQDFIYDGRGRLRKRIDYTWNGSSYVWSAEIRYVYDGMRVIQERNSGNTPTVSYVRGNDFSGSLEGAGGIGGMLARLHTYSSGNWSSNSYYHCDGGGNITKILDSGQNSVATYVYDPYGNSISATGTLATANTYRFSSKELHPNSAIYYYGYRFYDPTLARWLNRDPIQEDGGVNLYAFTSNDPSLWIDDLGQQIRSPNWRPPPGNGGRGGGGGGGRGGSRRLYNRPPPPEQMPPGYPFTPSQPPAPVPRPNCIVFDLTQHDRIEMLESREWLHKRLHDLMEFLMPHEPPHMPDGFRPVPPRPYTIPGGPTPPATRCGANAVPSISIVIFEPRRDVVIRKPRH